MREYIQQENLQIPESANGFYGRVYSAARKAHLEAHSFGGLAADIEALTAVPRLPYIPSQTGENQYAELLRDRDDLRNEAALLQAKESLLTDRLVSLGTPTGLRTGIGVLAYFSLVGVVLPIVLMPVSDDAFTPCYKWGVSILFITGIVAVLLYLWSSLRALAD